MGRHDIIVIGASAGGIEALSQLVSRLPADLPAAVFVVVHIPAHATSVLPRILNRYGPLPAQHAAASEPIRPGRIYVAPPDHHLLIRRRPRPLDPRARRRTATGRRSTRSSGRRPWLTGRGSSAWSSRGASTTAPRGSRRSRNAGGSRSSSRPRKPFTRRCPAARSTPSTVDHVLPVAEIADLLVSLAGDPGRSAREASHGRRPDSGDRGPVRRTRPPGDPRAQHPGTPSGFGCPDCGGRSGSSANGEPMRYRCRVGHAWTAGSLLAEQAETMESALWTALRPLEERASLCRENVRAVHSSSATRSPPAGSGRRPKSASAAPRSSAADRGGPTGRRLERRRPDGVSTGRTPAVDLPPTAARSSPDLSPPIVSRPTAS